MSDIHNEVKIQSTAACDNYEAEGKIESKKLITPNCNDIVSGRGSGSNKHEGNLYFRKLIRENKDLYLSRCKNEKMAVARDIYDHIEKLDPPGRFLQKNPETERWFEIGKDRALEKISQALREKNNKKQPQSAVNLFMDHRLQQVHASGNYVMNNNMMNNSYFDPSIPRNVQAHSQLSNSIPLSSPEMQARLKSGSGTSMSHGMPLRGNFPLHGGADSDLFHSVTSNVADVAALRYAQELRQLRDSLGRPHAESSNAGGSFERRNFLEMPQQPPFGLNQHISEPSRMGQCHPALSNHDTRSLMQFDEPLPSFPEVPHYIRQMGSNQNNFFFPQQQQQQQQQHFFNQQQQQNFQYQAAQQMERERLPLYPGQRFGDDFQFNNMPFRQHQQHLMSGQITSLMGNSFMPSGMTSPSMNDGMQPSGFLPTVSPEDEYHNNFMNNNMESLKRGSSFGSRASQPYPQLMNDGFMPVDHKSPLRGDVLSKKKGREKTYSASTKSKRLLKDIDAHKDRPARKKERTFSVDNESISSHENPDSILIGSINEKISSNEKGVVIVDMEEKGDTQRPISRENVRQAAENEATPGGLSTLSKSTSLIKK